MVEDLNIDVEIIVCPTIRDQDGLAMSSRNSYLNEIERKSATVIYKCLKEGEKLLKAKINPSEVSERIQNILKKEPVIKEIQYAGVFDPFTLEELKELKDVCLIAIAVKIGETRLIDNLLVNL